MNYYEQSYSDNWKNLGTLLTFKNKHYQFKSSVIIVELDQCLVKPLSRAKIYNTRNSHTFEIYEKELIKKLQDDNMDHSIVILSNQINSRKLNIDIIKRKIEMITSVLDIPIIGFFALKSNCFMKPHTGMWKLLQAYYKKYGGTTITKAVVVSNEGGMVWEKDTKSGVVRTVAFSDVDRAFANNIGMPFKSIDEYLDDCQPLDYEWDRRIIVPEMRTLYADQIKKRTNESVFEMLDSFVNCDTYVIMIMGAPRCGKTRLAKHIVEKWQNSSFGEMNEVERLGLDSNTKRGRFRKFKALIDNRISVVVDGECNSNTLRQPFLHHIVDKNIPVLVIEVTCGLQMAKVFNHAHVEESADMNVVLYKRCQYDIYKSNRTVPSNNDLLKYMLYTPSIEETPAVMLFRY